MISIKNVIWKKFGGRYNAEDLSKDANDKGTFQRYNEMLADELDNEYLDFINNLTARVVNPLTALERFLVYFEETLGVPFYTATTAKRRKLIRYSVRFNQIKGTKKAISKLIELYLGFSVTITEQWEYSSFDSSTYTLDDPERRFDQTRCQKYCTGYIVAITGNTSITQDETDIIFTIVEKNQPINARLLDITYNGSTISNKAISTEINDEGYLLYEDQNDKNIQLDINDEGELIMNGQRANRYSINDEGELIYTF